MRINPLLPFSIFLIFYFGEAFKVAIIGGGIGGASSAYFLRKSIPSENELVIHVFNSGNIGGRLKTISMQYNEKTRMFEAGGSIIHPANFYIKRWLREFGLHKKEESDGKNIAGIWNGKEYVFLQSKWTLLSYYRLFRRYGLDLLKNHLEIRSLLHNFGIIYKLLDKGQSFDTVDAIAGAIGIASYLNRTMKEHLIQNNFNKRFITEYAAAALNCNYGQSVEELHAFVGAVGLAGSVSDTYAVNGSNKLVVEKLIDYSKAEIFSQRVAVVSKRHDHFVLFGHEDQELGSNYDYVIVAAPLHQEQRLQLQGVDMEEQRGKYKHIIATFVEGSLRTSHWSLSDSDMLNTIYVCNNNLPYNSIGQILPVDFEKGEQSPTGSGKVWKVFSAKELTNSELMEYFDEIKNVTKVGFLAYPDYEQPPFDRPKFRLAKGICFVNAVEWMASAIEMSAIGSRNCVNMLLKDSGFLTPEKFVSSEL